MVRQAQMDQEQMSLRGKHHDLQYGAKEGKIQANLESRIAKQRDICQDMQNYLWQLLVA